MPISRTVKAAYREAPAMSIWGGLFLRDLVPRPDYLILSNNKNCETYIKRRSGIRSAWMPELAPKIWSKVIPTKMLTFSSTSQRKGMPWQPLHPKHSADESELNSEQSLFLPPGKIKGKGCYGTVAPERLNRWSGTSPAVWAGRTYPATSKQTIIVPSYLHCSADT